jgi:hypothetical protein
MHRREPNPASLGRYGTDRRTINHRFTFFAGCRIVVDSGRRRTGGDRQTEPTRSPLLSDDRVTELVSDQTLAGKCLVSICTYQKGARDVPAARGSVRHCEAVEGFGSRLRSLLRTVEEVTSDGLVTPDETEVLRDLMVKTETEYAPLPAQASQQDGVLRWIGAVAHAGQVSPWIERITRETQEDEERMFAAAA